jgi:hypothetical protein
MLAAEAGEMPAVIANICEIVGAACEVVGALELANRYLHIKWFKLIVPLVSALWRGRRAREAAEIGAMSPEDPVRNMRGITLLIAGFMIRALPQAFSLTSDLSAFIASK